MGKVFVDLWLRLPPSGKAVLALIIGGATAKWTIDDFRHSHVSLMTLFLEAVAVTALSLAVILILAPPN
jgi:hypothetical protein